MALSVTDVEGGALLQVRASAGASRNAIRGEVAGRLKVAVTAPPEKGRANKAVAKLLAGALGVALRDVELSSGATSRDKTYLVRGLGAGAVLSRLRSSTEGIGG